MHRACVLLLAFAAVGASRPAGQAILRSERSSASDLEVGGDLSGVAAGAKRYIRYADLLPQVRYTVSDDSNLKRTVEIQGVPLETLAQELGADAGAGDLMAVAICSDGYRANYPRDYLAAHRPVLVLKIDGEGPERWPKSADGGPLGPYMISHPFFKPAFKVLSHEDEAQVPFAVIEVYIRRESVVFGAIQPKGNWPAESAVEQGYVIARQDCFRCHNRGAEGGTLAGRSWTELGTMAAEDPKRFRQTIHDPQSVTPGAKMPAHGSYDAATLDALTAYFRTFAASGAGAAR
jgi:mono/diheme cytochrome c family protein